MERAEHSGNDQGKECIAYDTDRLEERAGHVVSKARKSVIGTPYMFPPRSLICIVTTASPIHTIAKTPEKTAVFWSLDEGIDSNKLRSRQNINGPLH